jgi:hypothetical protein
MSPGTAVAALVALAGGASAERGKTLLLLTSVSGDSSVRCPKAPAGGIYAGANELEQALVTQLRPDGWTFFDPCALGIQARDPATLVESARKLGVDYALTGTFLPRCEDSGTTDNDHIACHVEVALKLTEMAAGTVALSANQSFEVVKANEEKQSRTVAMNAVVLRITARLAELDLRSALDAAREGRVSEGGATQPQSVPVASEPPQAPADVDPPPPVIEGAHGFYVDGEAQGFPREPEARHARALEAATREGLKRAVSAQLKAQLGLRSLVAERILGRPAIFVRETRIIRESVSSYGTTLHALVIVEDARLALELETIKEILDRPRPKVLIHMDQHAAGSQDQTIGAVPCLLDSAQPAVNDLELRFQDTLGARWRVVAGRSAGIDSPTAGWVRERRSGAQVALVGTVTVDPGDSSARVLRATAKVEAQLIDLATGALLATVDEKLSDPSSVQIVQLEACVDALRFAGAELADQVAAKALETWPGPKGREKR